MTFFVSFFRVRLFALICAIAYLCSAIRLYMRDCILVFGFSPLYARLHTCVRLFALICAMAYLCDCIVCIIKMLSFLDSIFAFYGKLRFFAEACTAFLTNRTIILPLVSDVQRKHTVQFGRGGVWMMHAGSSRQPSVATLLPEEGFGVWWSEENEILCQSICDFTQNAEGGDSSSKHTCFFSG